MKPNLVSCEQIKYFITHQLISEYHVQAEHIDPRKNFSSYGLDSIAASSLLAALMKFLERELPITLFWEYPSIEKLTQALHNLLTKQDAPLTHSREQQSSRPNTNAFSSTTVGVIGMSCHFPGATNLSSFWELLKMGKDAIKDEGVTRHGVNIPYPGGYIEDVDAFDHGFFDISEHEALRMDPQQRLLLQGVVEACIDAGKTLDALEGLSVGVFVGIHAGDYSFRRMLAEDADIFTITGNVSSITANRISHQFDFTGPSISINTACSSSLMAVHLACQSLKQKECDLAIVGSANLILEPQISKALEQAGMTSPDGRCRTFDSQANGYVRSEGVGVIILKRVEEAITDGDRVYASILGGATNQDARSNGLTAPSLKAQVDVVRLACQQAGVAPQDIQYIELHGTGTQVGDSIEARALGAALDPDQSREQPCLVGSVKGNIGHLEPAAGIAGLIKLCLCLHHQTLIPNLHFTAPNPHIPFDQLPIKMSLALVPWPQPPGKQALAGISSFGFGGSNVHLILTTPPMANEPPVQKDSSAENAYLIPVSAQHPEALRQLLEAHSQLLSQHREIDFYQFAYNLCVRSNHFSNRIAISAKNKDELLERIDFYMQGITNDKIFHHPYKKAVNTPPLIVFVFPGQGQPYRATALELMQQFPVVKQMLQNCDAFFKKHAKWSIIDFICQPDDSSTWHDTEQSQPTLIAVQISLIELWRSFGIQPDAVIGHSMGEITAAYAAGFLTMEDAMLLAYARGKALQPYKNKGQMLMVQASVEQLSPLLESHQGNVVVAAQNSPRWQVLSAQAPAVEPLLLQLKQSEFPFRMLPGLYPFHGPWLSEGAAALSEYAIQHPRKNHTPFYSTTLNKKMYNETLPPTYWEDNVLKTVQFSAAVTEALSDGHRIFLEIAPHSVLSSIVFDIFRNQKVTDAIHLSTVSQTSTLNEQIQYVLGTLYTRQFPIHWESFFPKRAQHLSLPLYPWQKSVFWLESKEASFRSQTTPQIGDCTDVSPEISSKGPKAGAPDSAVQSELMSLWSELLNLSEITVDDHFLKLGGNSLLLTQMIIRANKRYGIEIGIRDVFNFPTIRKLGELIDEKVTELNLES